MQDSNEKLVPANVAARIAGKSQKTVERWVREGKVQYERPSPRKTLIFKSSLEAFRQED